MARLRITAPDGSREVALSEKLVVGRVGGVGLVLDDKGISRRHCEFEKSGTGWTLRDLGSSNGTLVNGEKASERVLADGDRIRVGGIAITFLERDADFALNFSAGEHQGREVPLTAERTTLGRRPDNAIPLVDVKVSGVHLEIVKEGDGFVLRDLGSTNGTFLDGRKVTEVALSHGDRVKFGENEFSFVDLRRGEGAAAAAADGAPRLAASMPAKTSRTAALLALAGIVIAVGGAAAWYFDLLPHGASSTSGRQAPPAPDGTLLGEEWSFEESATVAGLWLAELGEGFSARRGNAASGSFALAASVSGGATVAARRQAEAITAARLLRFSGQMAADEGALVSAGLRFLRAADDTAEPRGLVVVAARVHDSGFTPFDVEMTPPSWAKQVEVVVVARGEGAVAVDDLALVSGGAPAGGTRVGELALLPRGGGAFVVDHRAPLVELFAPFGSGPVAAAEGSGAPARVDLPPGAFLADSSCNGASFALRPGGGAFAPEGFAASIAPEVAAAGVTLVTARGSERHFGAFDVLEVGKLLIGSAAERFELALARPTRIAAVARGDALELRLFTKSELDVAWRAGFDVERKEAGELLARAQEDWRAGRAGAALAKLKEIRDRLPHDEKTAALAEQLDGEIVPRLQAELAAIDAEADAAEFLGSLERSRRTLVRAQALLAQAEGLESARELAPRVERMKAAVAAMERERREEEARRLLRLARAYEAQKSPAPERKATAAELLAELQRSYADTAAAREARGEGSAGDATPAKGTNEGGR